MKTPLSLKGRALQLLAQREHSRLELRRKLLRRLRDARREADGNPPDSESAGKAGSRDSLDPEIEVDTLLDWLLAHRYLSDERFVESRVHARSARYGNLRIRRELSQHGVGLTPDLAGDLRNSEQARAVEVRQRKFGGPPATLTERVRQARFLTARGFSSDVVRQVLRTSGQRDVDLDATHEDLDARHFQEASVNDEAD